jgi:putative toxin-antitoxin system antitoxin component (TIGR02293 family)
MLIYAQATDVLEDEKLAAEWLMRPNVQLRGERPLDMLDTQTGFDRVRDLLMRLEYGVTV